MKTYNDEYFLKNEGHVLEPLFTIEIAFDAAYTDLVYLTSSSLAQHPSGATVIDSVIAMDGLSTTSQKLDSFNFGSTIGGMDFRLIDRDGLVSKLIADKLAAGDGIRQKRVRLYKGFAGMDWAFYELRGTRLIEGLNTPDNIHDFKVFDVQRGLKNDIFRQSTTNLVQTLELPVKTILNGDHTDSVTTIAVSTTNIKTNSANLNGNHSDAISVIAVNSTDDFESSGTIIVESEHISYTGKTATTFTGCTRGAEGSIAATHVDNKTAYNTSPFPSSGSIIIDNEIISYTGKTYITFTGCVRETQGTSKTPHTDLSKVEETMMTVSVNSTTNFEPLEHDSNYTDAPNQEVGYIKLKGEIIRYFSKTSGAFTNCLRGALNTTPKKHEVKTGASVSRGAKIEEHIYIETTLVKILRGLLLGSLWGQSGKSFPSNWHLNMDPIWVRDSDFTGLPDSIWDSTANTGHIIRISGAKKKEAKRYIQSKLLIQTGYFLNIYADGDIGLKKSAPIIDLSSYVDILDETNVSKVTRGPIYRLDKVANEFRVKWNYSESEEKNIRETVYVDTASIVTHLDAPPIIIDLPELHGSIHTEGTIRRILDRLRDRRASPSTGWSLELLPRMDYLEVGDVIYLNLQNYRDHTTQSRDAAGAYEVIKTSVNEITGVVGVDIEGSGSLPGALSQLSESTSILYSIDTTLAEDLIAESSTLSIALASTAGLSPDGGTIEINNESISYLSLSGDNITFCSRGQHGTASAAHVIGDNAHNSYYLDQGGINIKSLASYSGGSINSETFVGNLSAKNAVYYHTSPLTINTGQTVGWDLNITLQVEGVITCNGRLTARAAGFAGAVAPSVISNYRDNAKGVTGFGNTISGGSLHYAYYRDDVERMQANYSGVGATTPPGGYLDYKNNVISGLDDSFIGTSGGSGYPGVSYSGVVYSTANPAADARRYYRANDGGASGGGALIICEGLTFGVNGEIDTSGADGPSGRNFTYGGKTFNLGAGAPGHPGGIYVLLTRSDAIVPDLKNNHTSTIGATPQNGVTLVGGAKLKAEYYSGPFYPKVNIFESPRQINSYKIEFLSDESVPEPEDIDTKPLAVTNLSATSSTEQLLELGDKTILSRIRFRWTPSTDRNVDYYLISFKKDGDDKFEYIADKPSRVDSETFIYPVIDGQKYILQIESVNIWGEKSESATLAETVVGKDGNPSGPITPTVIAVEGGVLISWTNPADKDLKEAWIYENTSNFIPSSADYPVATSTPGEIQKYFIKLDNGDVRYYWIRLRDTTDHLSNVLATTPTNIAAGDYTYPGGESIDSLKPAEPDSTDGASWSDNLSGRPKIFRITSVGFSSTSEPVGRGLRSEAGSLLFTAYRSYGLSVFDRATESWDSHATYDVWGSTANATALADALNALDSTKIVVIHTWDEPLTNNSAGGLPAALYRCGASENMFTRLVYRSAYALIGMPGLGRGNGLEYYSGDVSSDPDAWIDTSFQIYKGDIQFSGNSPDSDKTEDALSVGITLETGGITNTGLAAIEMGSVGVNPAFWINNATWQSNGVQMQYNSGNHRFYMGDGADVFLQYEPGVLTTGTLQTAATGERIALNESGNNHIAAYGDIGDGTIDTIATIGINPYAADNVVAWFGGTDVGTSNIAIVAQSRSNGAIIAENYNATNPAILGRANTASINSVGIEGVALGGIGVRGSSTINGIGIDGYGGFAGVRGRTVGFNPSTSILAALGGSDSVNLELEPLTGSGTPTVTGGRHKYVVNGAGLWIHDGTNWLLKIAY